MQRKSLLTAGRLLAANATIGQNVFMIGTETTLKTSGGVVIALNNTSLQNNGTLNQLPGEGSFRFTGTTGGIARGTSNVTVTRIALERYKITCPQFTSGTVIITSPLATGVTLGCLYNQGEPSFTVFVRRISDGEDIDQVFRFVAY